MATVWLPLPQYSSSKSVLLGKRVFSFITAGVITAGIVRWMSDMGWEAAGFEGVRRGGRTGGDRGIASEGVGIVH